MRYIKWSVVIGLVVGIIGCGAVDDRGLGDVTGAGGKMVDGGADTTMMGTGGAAGTGVVATGGVGGAPGRPLGAGCTSSDQCGSGICDSATSMCCNGAADSCNTCIGGYLTPKKDGTTCSTGGCDSTGMISTTYACTAGVCASSVVDCRQRWCVGSTAPGEACPADARNTCSGLTGATYCACGALINSSTGTAYVLDSSCP